MLWFSKYCIMRKQFWDIFRIEFHDDRLKNLNMNTNSKQNRSPAISKSSILGCYVVVWYFLWIWNLLIQPWTPCLTSSLVFPSFFQRPFWTTSRRAVAVSVWRWLWRGRTSTVWWRVPPRRGWRWTCTSCRRTPSTTPLTPVSRLLLPDNDPVCSPSPTFSAEGKLHKCIKHRPSFNEAGQKWQLEL